ncbi:hypothetical protein CPT_Sycamore_055 [Streptomyces phage Sycamore]|uniref:Uncharacterized protein n=1 Tax=Streptomyces phage Sycamore TaxID=2767589 RepID=A0A873WNF5_9CAUD|nr:hypothetical protein CPT_Sycamore_055 [Streptomyces phage Sycamore]
MIYATAPSCARYLCPTCEGCPDVRIGHICMIRDPMRE